jgi:cysteinyl-tRNA synthetase
MAVLFTFITRANAELDRKGGDAEGLAKARQVFATIDSVLDIVPPKTGVDADLAKWVEERIAARKAARASRNFGEADRIRGELSERGVLIEDSPAGTTWKLK